MYKAKLGGYTIEVGTTLEMSQITDFTFKVLEIRESSFKVEWLAGDSTGQVDSIPYTLFASIGHEVEVWEAPELKDNDPNTAWLHKRLTDVD